MLNKNLKMKSKKEVTVFENVEVRRAYDELRECWYFSLVDIISILTDSKNPTDYLKKLRKRDSELGFYLGTNCPQIEMLVNGKRRKTLAGNVQDVLRLVQSVPSSKAEPFKLWLSKIGYERIQELHDPEISINRARTNWINKGHSQKWIQQRMMGQETRNKLTDFWKQSGVKHKNDFALLTNIIHQEWSDLTVKEHKKIKGLQSQNLRDHMTEAELIFTALAEMSTRQIAEFVNATGVPENVKAGKKGGSIAKVARVKLEDSIGKSVVTKDNFLGAAPLKKSISNKK